MMLATTPPCTCTLPIFGCMQTQLLTGPAVCGIAMMQAPKGCAPAVCHAEK
jgi:hypothetical protein